MKKILGLLLIAALAVSCINVDVDEDAAKAMEKAKKTVKYETTGVFVHITHGSDDAHRALMGLMMATRMAENKDVAVYLDINAIELVLKESEPVTFEDHFPPSNEMIGKLLEKGVPIMACPGCMKVKGITEDMLMDGVKVASAEKFFSFTKGGILTLDY
ncbi:MAG: DsrE family protein [Bacteroidales bacterium]|jgi:predicted peroxiredoxin|nr:DsrE family protein [Bacteroidales bacterium]